MISLLNNHKPDQLEYLLKNAEGNKYITAPDIIALSEEYQRLCQYYGYVQTIAPGSGLSKRGLSAIQRGRALIYRNADASRLSFLERLPHSFRLCAPYIFLSIVCGVISGLLAALLIFLNPSLVWTLLDERTVESLEAGHLWTERIVGVGMLASTSILSNNITVTFTAFALGITAGVGTLFVLIQNGFSLGSLFAAVYQYNMADKLLEFICAHGPLELSIIFVSGGAGLAIGDAILHPGELSRKEALKARVNVAFDVVILGAIGLFFAGFIEGLISPEPTIPMAIKVLIGLIAGSVYWSILVSGAASPFLFFFKKSKT